MTEDKNENPSCSGTPIAAAAARQLLALLTISCRTLARFEEERSFLFGIGIPGQFLPTARELGRDDLA